MVSKDRPGKGDDKPTGLPSGMLLRGVPDANILSRRDFELLGRAFSSLENGSALSLPLIAAIQDLAVIDRTSLAALGGSLDAADVTTLFADFEPWPAGMGTNRPAYSNSPAVLALRSPGAPLVAAFLAGGGGENGLAMVGRAITAFIWRAEPVVRVVLGARALAEGFLTPGQFGDIVGFASKLLVEPRDPKAIVGALRDGLTLMPIPWPLGDPPKDPRIPSRPPFGSYLTPENQAWMHCALGMKRRFPPLPSFPAQSPPPGIVTPAIICPGAIPALGLDITLASSGIGFGQQGNWGISLNGVAAAVQSWTTTEIKFRVTNLSPGCNRLDWSYATNWTPDDNGVGSACSEALRIPVLDVSAALAALIEAQTQFWFHPGSISVVAPRIQRLEASDGTGGTSAEACAPVTIDWVIDKLPCGGAGGLITARLLRDGTQIAPALPAALNATVPMIGSFVDRREQTSTYRLEVTSQDALGNSCGSVWREVQVVRKQKTLTLALPAEIRAGAPASVTVTVSCPAPAGGLTVNLASSPASHLVHPASTTVPAGATVSPVFMVSAGTVCGNAQLTATAANHSPASSSTCVVLAPHIVTFAPPAGLRACVPNSLNLVADCVSPALTAVAIDAAGAKTPLGVTPPSAAGGCLHTATVSLSVPPLPAGSYKVEIKDRGGVDTSAASFVLAPNPRILQTQPKITFTPQCHPATINVSITAAGADSVEFKYTSPDGGVTTTVARTGGGAPCAQWTAIFPQAFDRTGSVAVTPLSGTVRGMTTTIPVEINVGGSLTFSAATLRGNVPPAGRPAASVVRTERPCDGSGMPVTTNESALSNGGQQKVTLKRGTLTTFTVSWPEFTESGATSPTSAAQTTTSEWFGHPDAPEPSAPIDV